MKKGMKLFIWFAIILGTVSLIYYSINKPIPDLSISEKESLAKCLTQKGISLHGGSNCPGCVVQKDMFGEYVKLIIYVDCDLKSSNCIKGVPLPYWTIKNETVRGPVPLIMLRNFAEC